MPDGRYRGIGSLRAQTGCDGDAGGTTPKLVVVHGGLQRARSARREEGGRGREMTRLRLCEAVARVTCAGGLYCDSARESGAKASRTSMSSTIAPFNRRVHVIIAARAVGQIPRVRHRGLVASLQHAAAQAVEHTRESGRAQIVVMRLAREQSEPSGANVATRQYESERHVSNIERAVRITHEFGIVPRSKLQRALGACGSGAL